MIKFSCLLSTMLYCWSLNTYAQKTDTMAIEIGKLENIEDRLHTIVKIHESNAKCNVTANNDSSEVVIVVRPLITEASGIDFNVLMRLYEEMESIDAIVPAGLFVRVISLPWKDEHVLMYLRNLKGNVWVAQEHLTRYWIISPFRLFPNNNTENLEFVNLEFRDFVDADICCRSEFHLYQEQLIEVCGIVDIK